MIIEKVRTMNASSRFRYWITERESIRRDREAMKPYPWSNDSIFNTYRFCNVVRMDDTVSKWLLQNWYQPNYNHPNMLIAAALGRFLNLPASLTIAGFPYQWKPSQVAANLRKYRDSGHNIFNGAYIVRGNDGIDKIDSVVNRYVASVVDLKIWDLPTDRMEECVKLLKGLFGFGSFMAGQVVADLRHSMVGKWYDKAHWAAVGPGSARGINRYFSRPYNQPVKQDQFNDELLQLMQVTRKHLDKNLPDLMTRMEAHDFQNCCCEFDKYERTLFEGRRPKQLFRSILG